MRRFELVWVSLASIFMHFINVIRGWFAGRLPKRGMIDLYFYLTLMYVPSFRGNLRKRTCTPWMTFYIQEIEPLQEMSCLWDSPAVNTLGPCVQV